MLNEFKEQIELDQSTGNPTAFKKFKQKMEVSYKTWEMQNSIISVVQMYLQRDLMNKTQLTEKYQFDIGMWVKDIVKSPDIQKLVTECVE